MIWRPVTVPPCHWIENVHDVVALKADDLPVEPVEEDRVPRLVLDLRGDVELLLLAGADHEHRQLDSTCRSPWWKPEAMARNDCRSASVIFSFQVGTQAGVPGHG
ncbi:MAG TPA: hypothetical protein DHU96_07240 [Actinobacteria bacterium]|nr:hypothetical protein [Actinomycetota bacterium]